MAKVLKESHPVYKAFERVLDALEEGGLELRVNPHEGLVLVEVMTGEEFYIRDIEACTDPRGAVTELPYPLEFHLVKASSLL